MTLSSQAKQIDTQRARPAAPAVSARLPVKVFADLDAVEPIWRELEARGVTTPYQRFDWIAAIHGSGLDAEASLAIVVLYRRGKPVALLPLAITRSLGLSVGRIIGADQSNTDWMIADRAALADLTAEELLAAFAAVRDQGYPLDLLRFSNQPQAWRGMDNPLLRLPHRPAANNLYAADLAGRSLPYIDHHMTHKRRSNIRRGQRRLEESFGPVRLRRVETADEFERVHAAFLAQRAARFDVMGIDNIFAGEAFMRFFRTLATAEFGKPDPAFRFHALYAGEEIVATCCGAYAGGHYSQYINSTSDGPAARFSLMSILVAELLDELIGDGITSFDMGTGDFDYKRDWTEAQPAFDTVVPVSLAGRIAPPVIDFARAGKRLIKQNPTLWKLARGVRLVLYRVKRLGR